MEERDDIRNEDLESPTEENIDNDVILEEGESYTIVDNEETYLSFSVENLYKDETESKYRPRHKLKKSPPLLEVSSSDGQRVIFPLTANFTKALLRVLGDVNYAYLGINKTKKKFNFGKKMGFVSKVIDIFNSTKLSYIQLFLGMLLGISLAKGFLIGALVSFIISLAALAFHYSTENNTKEEGSNK